MKRLLIALLLFGGVAYAQSEGPLTVDRLYAEIGKLHVQIALYQEALQGMQAKIKELQDENKQLKEK